MPKAISNVIIALVVTTLLIGMGAGYMLAPPKVVQVAAPSPQSPSQQPPVTPAGAPPIVPQSLPSNTIKVLKTFDASGPPAYTPKPGDLLFFTNTGISFGAKAEKNGIVVVDAKEKKVVAWTSVDAPPFYSSHSLGVSPDAKYIYMPFLVPYAKDTLAYVGVKPAVAGPKEGQRIEVPSPATQFWIFDAKTLKPVKILDVGGVTHHVQIMGGKYIFVESYGPNGLFWLDPSQDNAVVGNIPFGKFEGYPYLGWPTPDGKQLFVTVMSHIGSDRGWIAKINMDTLKEEAAIPTGSFPVWVIFTKDGKTAYSTSARDSMVWKIDTTTNKVVGSVKVGPGPYGIRLTPDEKLLYVADKGEAQPARADGVTFHGNSITVVDPATMTVVRKLDSGLRPDHIYLSPDGKELWNVANAGQEIRVYDAITGEEKARIPMPNAGDPHGGAFVQYESDGKGGVQGRVVVDIGGFKSATPVTSQPEPQVKPPQGAGQELKLVLKNFQFEPSTITVKAGSKVTLTLDNQDDVVHNFVLGDAFAKGERTGLLVSLGEKKSVEWTVPAEAGTVIKHQCTFHPGMLLNVVVEK